MKEPSDKQLFTIQIVIMAGMNQKWWINYELNDYNYNCILKHYFSVSEPLRKLQKLARYQYVQT